MADNPATVRLVGAAGRSRTTPTGLNRRRVNRDTPQRGAYMRPLPRGCDGFAGAAPPRGRPTIREPPVLKGRQRKPWIPAFAGMTGFRDGARWRGNPRRRLDVVPCQIEGTPGLAFRRHSGEGRNPEPGRAAANGRSWSIHARDSCFRRGGPSPRPPVVNGEDEVGIL